MDENQTGILSTPVCFRQLANQRIALTHVFGDAPTINRLEDGIPGRNYPKMWGWLWECGTPGAFHG